MQERGFDALQTGLGPAVLIISTILLLAFIVAGGLFMRYKEMEYRAKHENKGRKDDEAPRPAS